jgi:hypothetical protein
METIDRLVLDELHALKLKQPKHLFGYSKRLSPNQLVTIYKNWKAQHESLFAHYPSRAH